MTGKKFGSIKWELSFFIVVLMVAAISLVSFFVLGAQKASLTEEVKLRGISIAKNLASNIADYILTDDELSTAKLLSDAMANKGAKYALVADKLNSIKADNSFERKGQEYRPPASAVKMGADPLPVMLFTDEKGEKVLDFAAPVIAKGKLELGTVHVGISYSLVEAVLKKAYLNVAVISLLAIVLGVLASILLGVAITGPISVLADGAKIIGTGNLDHRINVRSKNELGALAGVLNMMTTDLKRAQETVVKQQRLERELEVAREIQLSLIPKELAAIEDYEVATHYSPAKEVSGDYYDLLPLGKNRFGLVVADVSGKGVPAALVMTMARSILHSESDADISSSETLQKLNQIIFPDLREGMFITVFYGILDAGKNVIDIASAGHNDTYLMKATAAEVNPYNPKGFPIGTDPGPRFNKVIKNEKAQLEKGDLLVAYTDGITEAMNSDKQEYGDGRLIEVIKSCSGKSAKHTADAIMADVGAFTAGTEQSDDISLLVIKRI